MVQRPDLPPHPLKLLQPGEHVPCAGMLDKFVPDKSTTMTAVNLRHICNQCPVFDACLEWALHVREAGVWAGTSDNERKRIRRARGIIPVSPTSLDIRDLSK